MTQPLYYEEIEPGLSFDTGAMMVTESHIVQFAGLSGDFFDVHMDDQFAQDLGFPRRIAHGLLGLILTDGLKNRARTVFAGVASLNWNWNFRSPIFVGDRIMAKVTVTGKRLTRRADRGILTLGFALTNQHGEIVQEGTNMLMVLTRTAQENKA